jgi:hypothetical protein
MTKSKPNPKAKSALGFFCWEREAGGYGVRGGCVRKKKWERGKREKWKGERGGLCGALGHLKP